MDTNRKQSWDDLKNPGDYLTTSSKDEQGNETAAGIVMVCKCGDIISLSNKVHTFLSYEPLDISPSIGHTKNGTMTCHYFIKEGNFAEGR